MIITIYGEDNYRREERAETIFRAYLKKYGASSAHYFDMADEASVIRFFEFSRTRSLFGLFQMAILKNLNEVATKRELKNCLKLLAKEKNLIILISEMMIGKELAFLKQKSNTVEVFDALPYAKFLEFVRQEALVRGVDLVPEALIFLADVFRNDTGGVINELEKLSLLKQKITVELLRSMEGLKAPHDFFYWVRSLLNVPMAQRLKNLELLLSRREDPAKIFNILAYLNLREIKKFADYDVLIKSGKLDYSEALLELVISH